MNNRNDRDDQWRTRQQGGSYATDYPDSNRQSQQYSDYSGQFGSENDDYRTQWRDRGDSFGSEHDSWSRDRQQRSQRLPSTSYGDTGPYQGRYTGGSSRSNYGYGAAGGYAGGAGDWRQSFAGGSSSNPSGIYGGGSSGYARGYDDFGERDAGGNDRGFFARAGDEVMSWFGDEDAQRRREADNRGRGPSDYTRSDERIREDVNDRLTDDWRVDASGISVAVESGEVTLSGTVNSRQAKRQAEDCADAVSGVKHVQNNLRVSETGQGSSTDQSTSNSVI